MRKCLVIAVLAVFAIVFSAVSYAEQVQAPQTVQTTTVTTQKAEGFGGKLKLQGYGEYINFTGGDIHHSTWGGGVLARYLFLDWLGAQTNVSFYSKVKTSELDGDLSFANWRLSLLLHAYATDIDPKLYGYVGGGLGVQFNDDIGDVSIKDPLTGHVLAGIGYDITEVVNIEAEVGYQFGNADADNYKDDSIGVEALFVRLGAGVRF